MSNLSPSEATLLKPYIKGLLDLVEGRRKPETDAQRLFLECAKGKRQPVTRYEIAFVKWQSDKPDLDALIAQQRDKPVASPKSPKKKRRRPAAKGGMSAAKAKQIGGGRWSPEEIEAYHKKSGYNKSKIVVLQGGRVSPR